MAVLILPRLLRRHSCLKEGSHSKGGKKEGNLSREGNVKSRDVQEEQKEEGNVKQGVQVFSEMSLQMQSHFQIV